MRFQRRHDEQPDDGHQPEHHCRADTSAPAPTKDAPAPGSTVSPDAFAKQIGEGMAKTTTYRTDITNSTTIAGNALDGTSVLLMDRTDTSNVKMKQTTTMSGQTTDTIIIGQDVWSKLGDDKYTHSTLADLEAQGGTNQFPTVDTVTYYQQLLSGVTSITFVGPETLGGVSVSRYDLAEPADSKSIRPNTIYVDSQDRVAGTIIDRSDASTTMHIETKASGWGDPVDIQAPPADQVA